MSGRRSALAALALSVVAVSASAHGGHPVVEGSGPWAAFATGFLHPLTGPDHVVAMVAVGLWGAVLGAPALWLLPVVFPLVMALGVLGMPLPGVEIGIAASAIVLGLAVAGRLRPPLWVAALVVAVFAVFHGHAHGTELPLAANPIAYSLGFVMATGLLHLGGIGLGALTRWPAGQAVVRLAGGGIAALGGWFLMHAVRG